MKISVIIPVYNSEKYLNKCVDSVLNQTYKDFELILIDDGSNDKSGEIIDSYAKKDSRVKAFHQENSGPGATRNFGISKSCGDFAVFIDSDDYIDFDYFSLLEKKMPYNDVIFIDVDRVDEKGKLIKSEKLSEYKDYSKDRFLRAQMTGKILWGGVRKAVRISLLRENSIKYTCDTRGEEALYSFQILYFAKSFDFISEKPVYYYVDRENSQSKKTMDDPLGAVVEKMKSYLVKENLYKNFANTLNSFEIFSTVLSLDCINNIYKGKEKKTAAKERMKKFFEIYDKDAGVDSENLSIKAKLFTPFLKKGIYFPVMICSTVKRIL